VLLREIVLHNFGGYRGRHSVDVTPPSPDRPVILFGGLNGAGKTTLLDAMQLALYGKRARCAGRGNLGYDDYLLACINRSALAGEGAALELCFDATFDGGTSTFRVHRSWEPSGNGVRDHLMVSRDGIDSMLLTERWDEIVEEIMPLDISSLFFFDGEKIEAFADPERAGRVIATAVDSLLGLNLLERLTVDLVALERRKRSITADTTTRTRLADLESQVAAARADRAYALQTKAARLNDGDRAEAALRKARQAFRQSGGELFERRGELEQRRAGLAERFAEVQHRLIDIASGPLPLRLVQPLLEQVGRERAIEQEAERAELLSEALAGRDEAMLDAVGAALSKTARSRLERFLEADRATRAKQADVARHLVLPESFDQRLGFVLPAELDRAAECAGKLLASREALEAEIDEVDRTLAAVPAEDAIAALSRECDERRQVLAEAKAHYSLAVDAYESANKTVIDRETAMQRGYRDASATVAAEEDAVRIVEHSAKVRGTLDRFRSGLLDRHLSRIEAVVLDSLRRLLRKQQLVSDLRLDPETFALALYDRDGSPASADRLSAGERQLLAIALLWGLARISGRRLPTIIDTPLGRLDSTHRRLIVERYFPNASHQVLLLSTDEEIDSSLLEVLRPKIGRTYELRYDDGTSSTSIVDGYFFEEVTDVA
jgi:DNA sulfur modification protein DndD